MGRQSTKRFARLDGLLAACAGRGASSGIVASRVGGAATSLSKSAGRCPDAHGIFRASPTVHQCGHEGRVWVRFDPLTPAQPNGRNRRNSVGAVRDPQGPLRGHERPFSVRAEPEPAPVHLRHQSRTGAGSDRTSVMKVIREPAHPRRQTRSGAGSARATRSSFLPSYREADWTSIVQPRCSGRRAAFRGS